MSHSSDKYKRSLIILLSFVFTTAAGQKMSREFRKTFFKADKALEYGDYYSAMNLYSGIYAQDSLNAELNYKLGVCNYSIRKYRNRALKYFERTSVSDFPESNYYMGKLYHLRREYQKAIDRFTYYKFMMSGEEHTRKEIDDLIEKCNTAIIMESNVDRTLEVQNLGDAVNTEYPEYAPLIPAQENFMIFTSRRKNDVFKQTDPLGDYFEDLYISERKDKKWQAPVLMDTTINTPVHDAGTGLSADAERLLIYRTSKDLRSGDIYESNFVNSKWSAPQMLGSIVNDPDYAETSACYSPDGNTIFFSSNRPGGYGGKDLYLVRKLPNGSWGAPYNLGPTINTEYNEDAPFVHPVGNILFFSSEGHRNMGGYDIFKSTFDETGNFSEPQNMGCPINTVDDDIFFVLNTDASYGYFSSEREGGFGSQDIYSVYFPVNNIPLNVYNIHVFDESGAVLTNVDVLLTDMEKKSVYGMYKSNQNTGKVMVISAPDKTFRVAIQVQGYEPYISNVSFAAENELVFKLRKVQR
ncbi:MAG: hypothetical protein ACJ77K_06645 [Bacteroidia bacterium]